MYSTGVLVEKIPLEKVLTQMFYSVLPSFSGINSAILFSSNEANLRAASHFIVVLFSLYLRPIIWTEVLSKA